LCAAISFSIRCFDGTVSSAMKAMLLKAYKELIITEAPRPEAGPADLLVRVKACGICGSDVHGFDGSTGRRIPPIIMGHEAAGVVEQVGGEVTAFRAGDRVTFDSTVYCGRCHFCRRGQINLCDNRRVLGVSCGDYRQYGAFAEYVVVPDRIAVKLPDDLSFERAAIVEAVSIALHAVRLGRVELADSAVVIGAGMIGQLITQALRAAGCGRVISVDVDDTRLELARRLGADTTINAKTADVPAQVLKLTDGRGADRVFEAVGTVAAITSAIASARKGGTVVLVGNVTPKVEIPLQAVVTRELSLLGSCASAGEYPACLDMMARGAINVAPLISAVAPLNQGPSWFERLYRHEAGLMKIILTP
jgi:L-iditol 2-dehydrogenase